MKYKGEEDQFNETSKKITHEQIKHKNIVMFYDYIVDTKQKTSYLIQEFAPGKTLLKYLQDADTEQQFTENEARIIIKSILEGISYLHSLNICHRDLHHGNVIYDRQTQSVKIIDFSVARHYVPQETIMMSAQGKLSFLAPELLERKFYNNKIDVWSAGIILYSVLYGCLPFVSKDNQPEEVEDQILTKDVIFPSSRVVSEEAREFISLLLTKNPANRPTAEEALKHPFCG